MRLYVTASQLSGALKSLTTVCKRLEQHRGCLAPIHLRLESLLVLSVYRFIGRVTYFMSDEEAAHRARLMDVVTSASNSW